MPHGSHSTNGFSFFFLYLPWRVCLRSSRGSVEGSICVCLRLLTFFRQKVLEITFHLRFFKYCFGREDELWASFRAPE